MATETDIKRVKSLIVEAEKLGLDGIEMVKSLPVEEVAKEFNGIGPAWWPDWLRDLLSGLLCIFLPACMIHDIEYKLADGSKEAFHAANRRLGANCAKTAKAMYAWYDPLRYYYLKQAKRVETACEIAGWIAYKQAHETSNNKENT